MALTLSESAKQERKLPEAGATVGVLYSLVDLGHQETNFDNQKKWTPKVRLTFELPDQTDEYEVVENGKTTKVSKPMVVSIEQTRSLGEKASLRKLLEQWRGQTFTSKELQAFSLKNLLGKPAMLTLIHKTSQQGRQYCAIAGASKLPKGMKAPATTTNDQLYYEIEQGEAGQFSDMPDWLQEKIRASKEFATAAGKSTATKVEVDADGNQVPF
jgi:hypothetical protein